MESQETTTATQIGLSTETPGAITNPSPAPTTAGKGTLRGFVGQDTQRQLLHAVDALSSSRCSPCRVYCR